MTKTASWVHGNTARVQFPGPGTVVSGGHLAKVDNVDWTDVTGYPFAGSARFRGTDNSDNWFHFGIPTPVIMSGRQMSLTTAFVLFNSDVRALVTEVHVWDGPIFVAGFPTPAGGSSGRHDGSRGRVDLLDNITRWTLPSPHSVVWGIGIAVHVLFSDEGEIAFTAAGADFEDTPA